MTSSKLVLGTVQFGCDYGINSAGRPDSSIVGTILQHAKDNGITCLDTSSAYGNSEEVLGSVLGGRNDFRIISKYPQCSISVPEAFEGSLKRLGREKLYGYLLHHFCVYENNPAIWQDFIRLKEEGKTQKIGFSLYSTAELDRILDDGIDFQLLQVPRNILDRQFDSYFPLLKDKGVEIHVRSTFLQGLFFKDRNSLPEKLLPLRKYLLELDGYAQRNGISMEELALSFNVQNPYIDGVLIGVDNTAQLDVNIASASGRTVNIDINVQEKELLSPVNWK